MIRAQPCEYCAARGVGGGAEWQTSDFARNARAEKLGVGKCAGKSLCAKERHHTVIPIPPSSSLLCAVRGAERKRCRESESRRLARIHPAPCPWATIRSGRVLLRIRRRRTASLSNPSTATNQVPMAALHHARHPPSCKPHSRRRPKRAARQSRPADPAESCPSSPRPPTLAPARATRATKNPSPPPTRPPTPSSTTP